MEEERKVVAWQAARHQYGPGKLHEVDLECDPPSDLTGGLGGCATRLLCGRRLDETPGHLIVVRLVASKVDCIGCRQRYRTRTEWNAQQADWEARQEKYRRESAQRSAEWWDWYHAYLQSSEWQDKRQRVLERDEHVCRGCGLWPATQVHHLTYQRVGHEMLFDLVAICDRCHDKIHATERDIERERPF